MTSVGVIGAGAWGTVIANIMADNGHDVTLWCYKNDIAKAKRIFKHIIDFLGLIYQKVKNNNKFRLL